MTFKASFDWSVKILTSAFCLFYFTFLVLGMLNIETSGVIMLPIIMTVVILITYLWHVQSYEITSGGIEIKRPIGSKLIGFSSIKHVNSVKNDDIGFIFRLFGNSGIFGFTGLFKSRFYGDLTFYGTQQRNYIIIETNLKKYVLTPDEPFDFVKSVENRVGVV
jgi:Bacterial PH domain